MGFAMDEWIYVVECLVKMLVGCANNNLTAVVDSRNGYGHKEDTIYGTHEK
jgi:hypothetical protein